MVRKGSISVAAMHKICKKAGAERVSKSAAAELAEIIEEVGIKIAKEALDYTMHAGRKTIKAKDIRIAAEKLIGSSRRLI
ncbi:MAG: histone [Candidatus Bathyarchaeota archaeon B26-2]|nr:MAG: histone [Candidatus Bathyarchaeota archaeon B26-2]